MAPVLSIDLNCDMAESFGRYQIGNDQAMMGLITSANIACGFHAGDPAVMANTVGLAKKNQVAVGAHPGYPDLQGFGRRQMGLSLEEISTVILYQLGALEAFTRSLGTRLVHVKPHGALYNLAAQDELVSAAIAKSVYQFDHDLILVGLAGSELTRAGRDAGLTVANEGFPDRRYMPDGILVPRSQDGAVIEDPAEVAKNALHLALDGIIKDSEKIQIDTLCLHGDNPKAVKNAQRIRTALESAGVRMTHLENVLNGRE